MTLSENPIYNRSRIFAKEVIKVAKEIRQDSITRPMISQLIKSTTSIGANVSEATYGASRKDFINKITIALKEGRETEYWLDIIGSSGYIPEEKMINLTNEVIAINKILSAIRQNATDKVAT